MHLKTCVSQNFCFGHFSKFTWVNEGIKSKSRDTPLLDCISGRVTGVSDQALKSHKILLRFHEKSNIEKKAFRQQMKLTPDWKNALAEDGLVRLLDLQAFWAIGRFEVEASSSLSLPLEEEPEVEPPVEEPDEFRSDDLSQTDRMSTLWPFLVQDCRIKEGDTFHPISRQTSSLHHIWREPWGEQGETMRGRRWGGDDDGQKAFYRTNSLQSRLVINLVLNANSTEHRTNRDRKNLWGGGHWANNIFCIYKYPLKSEKMSIYVYMYIIIGRQNFKI